MIVICIWMRGLAPVAVVQIYQETIIWNGIKTFVNWKKVGSIWQNLSLTKKCLMKNQETVWSTYFQPPKVTASPRSIILPAKHSLGIGWSKKGNTWSYPIAAATPSRAWAAAVVKSCCPNLSLTLGSFLWVSIQLKPSLAAGVDYSYDQHEAFHSRITLGFIAAIPWHITSALKSNLGV